MSIKQGRILNRFDTSGVQTVHVDFKNPESQKAIKKIIEFLKNNADEFQLEPGETYQSVAEDLVCDVIKEEAFMVSSVPINELIFSEVLRNLNTLREDESYTSHEVAEPDTEDALHYLESFEFEGTEKQVKWAKDIALKNINEVAQALRKNKSINPSAKWWIDNRNNINISL